MFRTALVVLVLSIGMFAQVQEETVSVPKSKLTEQQKADLRINGVQSYVGMGKEIGDAVNSSLAAITTQSNSFAQTPVGKLTVCIVIWKVIGDQAVHILGAGILLLLCVPIWIWSFRKNCMTRRIKIAKDTWKVVEYDSEHADMTPRIAHSLFAVAIVGAVLFTLFSY